MFEQPKSNQQPPEKNSADPFAGGNLPSSRRRAEEERLVQVEPQAILRLYQQISDFKIALIDGALSLTRYGSYTQLETIVDRLLEHEKRAVDPRDEVTSERSLRTLHQVLSETYNAITQCPMMVRLVQAAQGKNFPEVDHLAPQVFQIGRLAQRPDVLYIEIGKSDDCSLLKQILQEGAEPNDIASLHPGPSAETTYKHIHRLGLPVFVVHRSPNTIRGNLFLEVNLSIEDDGVDVFSRLPRTSTSIESAFNTGIILRSLISASQLSLFIKSPDILAKEGYDDGLGSGEDRDVTKESQQQAVQELMIIRAQLKEVGLVPKKFDGISE